MPGLGQYKGMYNIPSIPTIRILPFCILCVFWALLTITSSFTEAQAYSKDTSPAPPSPQVPTPAVLLAQSSSFLTHHYHHGHPDSDNTYLLQQSHAAPPPPFPHSPPPHGIGNKWKSIKYSTVVGFFAQDLPETDEDSFDYISSNFGLLDKFKLAGDDVEELVEANAEDSVRSGHSSRPRWDKFKKAIEKLNKKAPRNVKYKVLFLARHGQGYHNVAESYYGTHLWDCYWSLLDGNGTSVWSDAKITKIGLEEAVKANAAWKKQIKYRAPIPEAFYSSPLSRAAQTLVITWEDIVLNKKGRSKPVLFEKLRETLGIHTCDRRSTKSELQAAFPQFTFSPNFPEEDPFWDPIYREPNDARDVRLKSALDDIMARSSDATYISFSMHGGTISSVQNVIGHRPFRLQTGGMMPTVIRVEYSSEEPPTVVVSPSQPAPTCTVNPTPAPTVA